MFRTHLFLIVFVLFVSCSGSSGLQNSYLSPDAQNDRGLLLVKNQLPAPSSFQSIQLYKKGNSNNPPIINLNTNDKLVLEFDELTSISGQFRITFEHFDQNWNPSNLPEAWFIDGFNEINVIGGEKNSLSKPSYFHYKTEFPNRDTKFLASGNYMLHVFDYSSNKKLFSLPFFVTEQLGKITSNIETVYNSGQNFSSIDQLFSVYQYPSEVEFPQFDLSFEFVQNRFWGNSTSTQTFDVTTPGSIRFYTPRDESFSSNFDFIPLDLTQFNINIDKIENWQPEFTPPRIILKRDVLNFSASSTELYRSNFGKPSSDRDAAYAEVNFRFSANSLNSKNPNLYVAGDFNAWRITENSKLRYDKIQDVWTAKLLIKEGTYRYKYFRKSNSSTSANGLPINDTSATRTQEYISFVYYKDPIKNYQRLISYNLFRSIN
ncbi:MAG: type IX secretion system plug protein domain-containing protein [Balneola sp.]